MPQPAMRSVQRSSVHSVARRIATVVTACHVGLLPPVACAEGLAALLDAVAENARFATPARADVRITCGEGCTAGGRPAILLGRGDAVYVEVRDGPRALVRPDHALVLRDGKAVAAPAGEPLAGSDVLLQDLAVFTPSALNLPQISDDSPAGVVVTAAPAGPSPYALLVHTIDRDRRTIVRTLYYRERVNELGKTRRDGGFVRVGGSWRPGDITVDSMRTGTTTHLVLSWREAPEAPPVLFEPAGLERPSGLSWP